MDKIKQYWHIYRIADDALNSIMPNEDALKRIKELSKALIQEWDGE